MARISPNEACPCGSGVKYKRCCRVAHYGAPAPTAEALMRSRYTAHALGLSTYIIQTTDPGGPAWRPPTVWKVSLDALCSETEFVGLEIREVEEGEDEAQVTFRVDMRRDGAPVAFVERSRFRKVDGRWLYHSGATTEA